MNCLRPSRLLARAVSTTFGLALLLTTVSLPLAASVTNGDGTVDFERLDSVNRAIEPFVRSYPPRFTSQRHRDEVLVLMKTVVEETSSLVPNEITRADRATALGHFLGMGHNAGLGTAQRAVDWFERAMTLDPESRQTNFLYGMFQVGTARFHQRSEPYLAKALELGEEDAAFPLALVRYGKGDHDGAVLLLENYLRSNPNAKKVQAVLEAVKSGELRLPGSGG